MLKGYEILCPHITLYCTPNLTEFDNPVKLDVQHYDIWYNAVRISSTFVSKCQMKNEEETLASETNAYLCQNRKQFIRKTMKIKMGDYDLLESGSIITEKDATVHFYVQDLEYVLSFIDDETAPIQIRTKSNTGKRMELELVNFKDPFGAGNISPFPMGRIGAQQLFLLLRVSSLKEGGKTILYSWYTKQIKNESNGD